MGKPGRPPVLDEMKKSRILAIVSLGCSQNVAAQYVGCAPSTIQRTAERDPKFAAALSQAKCHAELGLIRQIRNAAKKARHWRAAAWALERGFPERYAPRSPDVITVEQIGRLLSCFSEIIVKELPERYRKKIIKRMDMACRSLGLMPRKEPDHGDL